VPQVLAKVLAVHVDSASQVLYYATTTVRAGAPQHALVRVSLTSHCSHSAALLSAPRAQASAGELPDPVRGLALCGTTRLLAVARGNHGFDLLQVRSS
jgi:hypothetical protein